MNFYFDSDIFRGKKAGIYRYSKEMATRFYRDPEVNCRFVSSLGRAPAEFSEILPQLFGERAELYEMYASGEKGRPWARHARDDFQATRAQYASNPTFKNKLKREFARLRFNSENRNLEKFGAKFHFDGECPVVFGPHNALSEQFLNAVSPLFKVQVIYDLIPVLFKEYFDDTRVFDRAYDTLNRIDLVVTISESTRADLLRLRPDLNANQVVSIPLAASDHFVPVEDPSRISDVKNKYGIPHDSDYLFTVSTVEPRKNQLGLVEAWSRVYKDLKMNNPKLVIAGRRGWGKNYLAQLEGHDEIDNTVIFTGFVEDEDLPVLYAGSLLTAYPSFYEGFGIPVLESMGCGRFCVTSNTSSIPEIVGEGYPLVDPKSVDEIASLIVKGVNDDAFRQKMEHYCAERVKLFSWDKTYKRTKDVIQSHATKYFQSLGGA